MTDTERSDRVWTRVGMLLRLTGGVLVLVVGAVLLGAGVLGWTTMGIAAWATVVILLGWVLPAALGFRAVDGHLLEELESENPDLLVLFVSWAALVVCLLVAVLYGTAVVMAATGAFESRGDVLGGLTVFAVVCAVFGWLATLDW